MCFNDFTQSFIYLDIIKVNHKTTFNEDFEKLLKEIDNFANMLKVIADVISLYNFSY